MSLYKPVWLRDGKRCSSLTHNFPRILATIFTGGTERETDIAPPASAQLSCLCVPPFARHQHMTVVSILARCRRSHRDGKDLARKAPSPIQLRAMSRHRDRSTTLKLYVYQRQSRVASGRRIWKSDTTKKDTTKSP